MPQLKESFCPFAFLNFPFPFHIPPLYQPPPVLCGFNQLVETALRRMEDKTMTAHFL
jgi:hypothetical protein